MILVSRGNAPPVNHCQAVAAPLLVSAARELIPVTEAYAGYVPGTWPPNPDAVLVATVRNSRNEKLQLAESRWARCFQGEGRTVSGERHICTALLETS